MGNSIFSTCVGYGPEKVENFIVTCRRVFEGDIHVIAAQVPVETIALLKRYAVHVHLSDVAFGKYHGANEARYPIYWQVIESNGLKFDHALICDIRDVIFQSDPFAFSSQKPALKFFTEDRVIAECDVNASWMLRCYGSDVLGRLGHNTICCSGTVMGSYEGITSYLDAMHEEICRTIPYHGSDQVRLNYLINTGRFPDAVLQKNRTGEVQTLHHQKVLAFSRDGLLVNDDGRVCPVIHQYDRHVRFFPLFDALAKSSSGPTRSHSTCSESIDPQGRNLGSG